MLDVAMLLIHTQFILTGAGGGFLHVLHDRKLDPKEVARYILAAILLSNFVGPLVLVMVFILVPVIPIQHEEAVGNAVGFILGYGVSRFCRFLDRYFDKELKPYERPEHE